MKKQKSYTTEQVMSKIKKNLKKKQPVVNSFLKVWLKTIINLEIKKEARAEAMRILLKAKRAEVAEFLISYHSDGNSVGLCCMALDFIKNRLVKDKEIGKNFGSHFGNKFKTIKK